MAQQVVSIDELRKIESLIVQKDCGALYAYLSSNPHIIATGDVLAKELLVFQREVELGNLDCFASQEAAARNLLENGGAFDEALDSKAEQVIY